ncbi:MAG: CAP domain-containing protein [Solirubrobacterales bacterium]|nr:CAP domain-containing protein [Solirubrobacterales bacterium]
MSRSRALLLPALAAVAAALPAAGAPAAAVASPCGNAALKPTSANLPAVRHATLCLLNRERRSRGLRGLKQHRALERAASRYARAMVRHGFFDHVSPGGSTMVGRVRDTSYLSGAGSWSLGENLAWGSGSRATPSQTVDAWMHSPGHRRNILDGRFREIGIGVATGAPVRVGGDAATYATDFGFRS